MKWFLLGGLVLAACGDGASGPDAAPDARTTNVCEDGTVCAVDDYCRRVAETLGFACAATCVPEKRCGDECCADGLRCQDGACALPDLTIDTQTLAASTEVVVRSFAPGACELEEGCIGATGPRTLLRFTLRTPNVGEGDLELGDPELNPVFDFSDCHGHHHFSDYAYYRLLDLDGNVVASGHKQGFCLLDGDRWREDAAQASRYGCQFQGIQAGWADTYGSSLPCQWVDVSGLAAGAYELEVSLNPGRTVPEASYDNNIATVPVVIPASSCEACSAIDDTCCRDGNPCALAGNGVCDCGGLMAWDAAECSFCLAAEPTCPETTTCPGGCTPVGDPCCNQDDTCNLGWNGVCDCGNTFWWEYADCEACVPLEDDCSGASTCPGGCTANAGPCCGDTDTCGWADDGVCDCGGAFAWDAADCTRCISDDPDCAPFDSCPGGCLPYDPSDGCCDWSGDLCGRALNGVCDCSGWMSWDDADCAQCDSC